MLRNPQQIDNADKAAASGELRRDVRDADLEQLRDDEFARRERVVPSDLDLRSLPQAHGGCDLTAANAIAECPKELHPLSRPRVSSDLAGELRPELLLLVVDERRASLRIEKGVGMAGTQPRILGFQAEVPAVRAEK